MAAPGLRLHPRTMPVQRAEAAVAMAVATLQREWGLTDVEMLRALLAVQQGITRHMLRAERHPDDPERKADEE
jgi:hypothetical protein